MAILVIAGGTELDESVVERLLSQGDEVRVLEPSGARRERWQQLGAFLAVGEGDDPDLVERAAQDVRTVVVLSDRVTPEIVATVLEAGPKAGVDRLICCAPQIASAVRGVVRASRLDHILLQTGRPGLLRRKTVPGPRIAEAVDAADDLAGDPRLEIDLTDPEQGKLLGI
jgi:hypothetical protein